LIERSLTDYRPRACRLAKTVSWILLLGINFCTPTYV